MDWFSKRRKLYLYTANSCSPQRGKNRQIFKWQQSLWLHGSQFAQSGSYIPPVRAAEMDNNIWKSYFKICSLFHRGVVTGSESLCQRGKWSHDLAYKQKHFPKESGQNHGAWLNAKKREVLKGQHDDGLYFTLLTLLQLFAGAGRQWEEGKSQ